MAKKLADIKEDISRKNIQFIEYFYSNLNSLNPEVNRFVAELTQNTNTYIFSGIIRDFFLFDDNIPFRDIDIIIEDDIQVEDLFGYLKYEKNSFGGYKIIFDDISIDLWVVKKTWGLSQGQLTFEFDYLNKLPYTTFFNFSSILYSLNNKEFIIGIDFLRFIRDKKIELVLEENPYPELCIVNSFYYNDKLNLGFGDRLKGYLKSNYFSYRNKIESIQVKHFGEIVYPLKSIEKKIHTI